MDGEAYFPQFIRPPCRVGGLGTEPLRFTGNVAQMIEYNI